MIIGLDGADPELTDRWMRTGRLPHLAELGARGAFLPLGGVIPPATLPAWTTCVTGVNPGIHGLADFTVMTPGHYAIRFLNSTDRRSPALWNILSQAGKRVCVLGVPGTYPPEAVNGVLVSGFDSPVAGRINSSCVYPREAFSSAQGWRYAAFQEHRITSGWYNSALASLEKKIVEKADVAHRLLTQEPWDFFMVVFGESDAASHHLWPLQDTMSPRRQPGPDFPEEPIRRVYERLDAAVGRLIAAAGPEDLVMVLSDHGFGGTHIKAFHPNNFLAEHRLLRFLGRGGGLLKQAALRVAPVALRGTLFRYLRPFAEHAEGRARFAGIDWPHTVAWSEELDYFPSVRVNLKGREPGGIVEPRTYSQTVEQVCALLESSPAVTRAWPRECLVSGPCVDRFPDILFEPAWEDGYRYSCVRARGGPAISLLPRERWAGGKERGCAGAHRNPALLILNHPCVKHRPALVDIAPTVLTWLGISGPTMEGRCLLHTRTLPAQTSAQVLECARPARYNDAEEDLLEQRLRDLGYFE